MTIPVLPSRIVSFVDNKLGFILKAPAAEIPVDHKTSLNLLVDMCDHVPTSILACSKIDLVELEEAKRIIRNWPGEPWLRPRGGNNPVVTIRGLLSQCPDQVYEEKPSTFAFIEDDELRSSIIEDLHDARSNHQSGRWKASIVMAGSAIEATLLFLVERHMSSHPSTRSSKTTFHDLITFCETHSLLPERVLAHADSARIFRNLIHAERSRRLAEKCTAGKSAAALAALELLSEV